MVESMQQSSATPSLHLVFLGLRKIVACSQPYLAVASCTYSFWHGVIPTSYFIFNDFYTCIYTLPLEDDQDCKEESVQALQEDVKTLKEWFNASFEEILGAMNEDVGSTPNNECM